MAWKIAAVFEGRNGDLAFLPEWAIGTHNDFSSIGEATIVRDAMQAHADRTKIERPPGVGAGGPSLRYMVLPAIDQQLIAQLRSANPPAPQPQPTGPVLQFGGGVKPSA